VDKIVIRPSSLDNFLQCPQQWKRVFIDGETSIPSARAAIGTAIHKAAEVLWTDAMKTGRKDTNITKLTDAAVDAFQEEEKLSLSYNDGEDSNTATKEIVSGTEAFVEGIVPFTEIPTGVEKRFTYKLDGHPVVESISGTVDYICGNVIADVKTSKRKPTVNNYKTQQSIYKILANKNGEEVTHNLIQGVILKKQPEATILEAAIDETQAKAAVNSLLDTLDVFATDKVDPNILFRGNPKYYLCSNKFCAFYNDCKFVKGD
jgi:hypothetical protein